jgi:lysophospholipase L1-like esterase
MEGQLHAAQQSHYDLVLIQVGANDIVGVGSLDAVNAHMKTLLDDVQRYSDHIVLMTAGRVGDAPLLPILARPFLNWRTAKLRTLFMENAIAHAVAYVDLYTNPSDVFASDTSHYYAIDMFHPSAAGYAVWFAVLEQTIRQSWRGALYGDQ